MKNKRYIFFSIILVSVGWYRGYGVILQQYVDTSISYATYPCLYVAHVISSPLHNIVSYAKTVERLREEIKYLKEERNKFLEGYIQSAAAIDTFNDQDEIVHFKHRYKTSYMHCAQIISKQLSPLGHYYLIDIGSKHGVTTDMVAVYKNCLLGRVVQVYPYYSKVVLITDPSCKVASYTAATKAEGIHEGLKITDKTKMMYVHHLHTITPRDVLISSGEGAIFPKGFGLSQIVQAQKNELYYDIIAKPLVDFNALRYCYILQKGSECLNDEAGLPETLSGKITS